MPDGRHKDASRILPGTMPQVLRDYIAIARPDHWFKNIFMLPGIALAMVLSNEPIDLHLLKNVIVAVVATCLIASANYTINEWLDAATDRFHPVKHTRPSAAGRIREPLVYVQWTLLAAVGLALSITIGEQFTAFAAALLVMGVIYNVPPFRTKDRIYVDVLSESINNPLRFMLGWSAVVGGFLPPSSALIAYWMGGAYLMAVKRYAEFRFIGDGERAGQYRRSFKNYTEQTLLLSTVFYALTSAFFFGVFLVKYRVEFILAIPFLAFLFVWYLRIGMRADSVTQRPEKLYTEKKFVLYVVALSILIAVLFFVDIPWLNVLTEPSVYRLP